jgi:YesN/AraC family two-component response regulator
MDRGMVGAMDKLPNYAAKKFLLVDDETFMLGLIDRVLKQCQAGRVQRAANGGRALELFQGKAMQVDCIIADLNMKPMNGLELLQAVRAGIRRNIPRDQCFIMLTGNAESDAVKAAIALDVHGYILKPISIEKLVSTIDMAFGRTITLKDAAQYRAVKLPDIQEETESDEDD